MLFIRLNIQRFAHVKAQGSTQNGRDSVGRRLGAKASDGEVVSAGSIIYRQRGTKIYPGTNVGMGKDHTLYAKIAESLKVNFSISIPTGLKLVTATVILSLLLILK